MRDALIILSGFLAGILSGTMGIGGGVLMVPIMVLGFGFSETLAQGTSLAAIVPISLVGAVTHFRQGNVLLRPALWMAALGAPLAIGGALAAQHVPGPLLSRVFGAFLLFSAYRIWPLWKPTWRRAAPPGPSGGAAEVD
jgi:uncharacterized membrane protein YfcA